MSHYLEFGTNNEECWAISSYLLIHSFTFNRNTGKLEPPPIWPQALFGLAAIKRPGGNAGQQGQPQMANLPRAQSCNFKVRNGEKSIANLSGFYIDAVSTSSSLDMSRAVIVAHGREITTDPRSCVYDDFGKDLGSTRHWGAELSTSDGIMLRASLSSSTYRWDTGFLKEYIALGPARSKGSQGSVFNWLVNQDSSLPTLTIHDVVSKVKNKLFGNDAQVRQASGAVFMMNGPLVNVKWRTLARFIRNVVEQRQDGVDLINLFPETALDQSVSETHLPVRRGELGVDTPDFEGIVVWGLSARDEETPPAPIQG